MRPTLRHAVVVLSIGLLVYGAFWYYRAYQQASAQKHYLAGDVKLKAFDYEGAIADFSAAIAVFPDHADSYYRRGFAHSRRKEWVAAIADFDRALALNGEPRALLLSHRATVRQASGDVAGAFDDANAAIRLDPKLAEAYRVRAAVSYDLGRKADALADFTKAIELEPDDAWQWAHRAMVRQDLGDTEQGLYDLREALKRDPSIEHAPILRGRFKVVPAP